MIYTKLIQRCEGSECLYKRIHKSTQTGTDRDTVKTAMQIFAVFKPVGTHTFYMNYLTFPL